jgi:hypothetical protein
MKEWLEQLCPEIEEWQVDLICEQVAKEVAAEREACAKVCNDLSADAVSALVNPRDFDMCAKEIRARGEK